MSCLLLFFLLHFYRINMYAGKKIHSCLYIFERSPLFHHIWGNLKNSWYRILGPCMINGMQSYFRLVSRLRVKHICFFKKLNTLFMTVIHNFVEYFIFISHLAQNPFMCDCHLKWLADYLQDNPIETSGARCTSPRRLANKRIGQIKSKKFRCSGTYSHENR